MSTSLVVVDLASSRLARSMVRRAGRRAIARLLGRASHAPQATPPIRVLLHGEDPRFHQLRGIELLERVDYAAPTEGSADEPWLDAVARELLYGSGARFFPTVDGISLADLCLLEVQDYFLDFVGLAGAIRRILVEQRASVCHVFASEGERAGALQSAATGLAGVVETWAPPFIRDIRNAAHTLRRHFITRHGVAARHAAGRNGAARRGRLPAPLDTVPPGGLEAPVLFVAEAPPMAEMFRVVARHLGAEHGTRSLRVAFGGTSARMSAEIDGLSTVATLGRSGVVPPAIAGRFDAQWRAVARDAWSTVIEKPYAGAVPATTLRAPVGQLLERLYLDRFDQLTEHIAFAGAILDAVRPQALVVGNDRWWVGQTFVRVAQRRGIPTLLVQDGLAIDKAQWSWIAADHVAAFSPAWARVLMAYGLSPDRITITGQPRFDELCTRRDRRGADSVRAARRTLALDHVACGILLATQPHQAPERVESAVRALLAVDGAHVLLRPHPTEPPGKYGRCVERNPRRVSVHAGTAIDLLVDAADIVVTEYSTVALEAAILDVPVIIVPFLGARREPQMFDDLGIVARDAEALREAARGLWPRHVSPAPRRTVDADRLYALVGPLDGRAGHRVAGLIQSLLSVRDGGAGSRPHPVGAALFA